MIDEVALEMHPMIQKIVTKVEVDDDLQGYVQDVNESKPCRKFKINRITEVYQIKQAFHTSISEQFQKMKQ